MDEAGVWSAMSEREFIPYGKQLISEEDIRAVVDVLRSDWLTTGPNVEAFEQAVAEYVDMPFAVALSSGTAALHATMNAAGIKPGDEVIVPALTFAATSNAVCYCGGTPVFADVNPKTLLIEPEEIEKLITDKTKAIISVDYAGQPCDYDAISRIAKENNLCFVSDACHSIGALYKGVKVGSLADMTVFSFHPVKPITTGEGGMVITENKNLYQQMRSFRNHGITTDHRERQKKGAYSYDMVDLGYNYRITDIQCVLGKSQLEKLDSWIVQRNNIARKYDELLKGDSRILTLDTNQNNISGYHLYVIRIPGFDRDDVFQKMRDKKIGVNVHYSPVYKHSYYQQLLSKNYSLTHTESAANSMLSLPIYPELTYDDVFYVVKCLREILDKMSIAKY